MCCGKRVMRPSGAYRPGTDVQRPAASQVRANVGPSFFEHVATGTLVVQGPASGKQYRFAGQGATVVVDPRDRASLKGVPHIRELRR
jgi:hypothetical protein